MKLSNFDLKTRSEMIKLEMKLSNFDLKSRNEIIKL